MSRRILITGGAGFIGSTLASRLVADGDEIVILDTLHRDAMARTALAESPLVTFHRADVRDSDAVEAAMEDCTHVVHMASIAGVDTVMRMPVETMRVSLIGTYCVLEAARKHGRIQRLIDFSTSEVFGRFAFRATFSIFKQNAQMLVNTIKTKSTCLKQTSLRSYTTDT